MSTSSAGVPAHGGPILTGGPQADRKLGLGEQVAAHLRGFETQRLRAPARDLGRRERLKARRHVLPIETPQHPVHDLGQILARKRRCRHPGTRIRYSRPPGTHRNFATVPARLGAVPSEPVPSSRWQPWQLSVQFCQARRAFSTPAGGGRPSASEARWAQRRDAGPRARAAQRAPMTRGALHDAKIRWRIELMWDTHCEPDYFF